MTDIRGLVHMTPTKDSTDDPAVCCFRPYGICGVTVSDENWHTDTVDCSLTPNAVAVEFRDNGEWRRYGLRFGGGDDQKALAVSAILEWGRGLGYELKGPQ